MYSVITTTYLAAAILISGQQRLIANLLALIARGAEAWNGSCGGFVQMPGKIMFTGLLSQTTKTERV